MGESLLEKRSSMLLPLPSVSVGHSPDFAFRKLSVVQLVHNFVHSSSSSCLLLVN